MAASRNYQVSRRQTSQAQNPQPTPCFVMRALITISMLPSPSKHFQPASSLPSRSLLTLSSLRVTIPVVAFLRLRYRVVPVNPRRRRTMIVHMLMREMGMLVLIIPGASRAGKSSISQIVVVGVMQDIVGIRPHHHWRPHRRRKRSPCHWMSRLL